MIKVGLTGNRYAGKDEVCNHFRRVSIPVFDADTILRFLIHYDAQINKTIREKLAALYGTAPGLVMPQFAKTKQEFDIMIECCQEKIFEAYHKFSVKNKHSIYTVFHSSFLFELGWNQLMDYNLNVFAPKVTRMERFHKVTGKKVSDIAYLLNREIDDLDKNKMSNFVIHNYDGRNVKKQVLDIDKFIIDFYLRNEQTQKLTPDGKGIIVTHY